MDAESDYMEYQDFGMALATTILVVLIAVLLRQIVSGTVLAEVVLTFGVGLGWTYSVYLTIDAARTGTLDPYKRSRPLRLRVFAGLGIFVVQLLIGGTYALI